MNKHIPPHHQSFYDMIDKYFGPLSIDEIKQCLVPIETLPDNKYTRCVREIIEFYLSQKENRLHEHLIEKGMEHIEVAL